MDGPKKKEDERDTYLFWWGLVVGAIWMLWMMRLGELVVKWINAD